MKARVAAHPSSRFGQERQVLAILTLLGIVAAAAWVLASLQVRIPVPGFLPFHIILELAAVIVAAMVFVVGREAKGDGASALIGLLAAGFLGEGLLDFAHLLAFKGMPDFLGPGDPEKAIVLWLMARAFGAATLLAAAFLPATWWAGPRVSRLLVPAVLVLVGAGFWVAFFEFRHLPRTFIEGQGLTPLKLALEYAFTAAFGIAAIGFWTKRKTRSDHFDPLLLFAAAVTMVLCEFLLTIYSDVTDLYIFLGHVYKIVAYAFVYHGVFLAHIRRPYRKLAAACAELEAANRRLEDADKHKDEFLHMISHELRTPLNFIMGFSSLLESGAAGGLNETQASYVERISHGATRMLGLVNNILEMSAMQAGRFSMRPQPTLVGNLVSEIEARSGPAAAEKGVFLECSSQVPWPVDLDPERILQVINGLVENALNFTPRGGTIGIQAFLRGSDVVLEVSDTGPGIAAEDLPRLFKPFSQLDMSTTRPDGGAGLGLAICKYIVEAHGGRIGVHTEVGRGSWFWFSLPAKRTLAGPDLVRGANRAEASRTTWAP